MTDATVTLTRSVVVGVPPGPLYGMCEDTESLAPLLADVESVERTGERKHRWRAELHGTLLTWETEAVRVDPPHRIEWRVRPRGEQQGYAGEVQFQPHPTGGTEVRVILSCEGTPGLSVSDTTRIVDDNLASFKDRAESRAAGSATGTEGQLDADRAASMADEGGAAAAETAGGTPPSRSR